MAKKTITTTEYTDDLDGGPAMGTVTFSVDGTSYEIDLSRKNRAVFEKLLKPYIAAARTAPKARAARPSIRARKPSGFDLSAVRAWATEQGLAVSSRGRISGAVLELYQAAH